MKVTSVQRPGIETRKSSKQAQQFICCNEQVSAINSHPSEYTSTVIMKAYLSLSRVSLDGRFNPNLLYRVNVVDHALCVDMKTDYDISCCVYRLSIFNMSKVCLP